MMSELWWSFGIAFLRCTGFLCLMPFPGGLNGFSVRTGIALAFSVFFAPFVHIQPPCGLFHMIAECLTGVFISLPVVLSISAAAAAGELIDAARGQTIGTMYDASASAPLSITSGLLHHYAWTVILLGGGFNQSLQLLARSFEIMPPGSNLSLHIEVFGTVLMNLTVCSLRACINLIVPFVAACFFVDICFGLVSRIAPGVSLLSESFQLKSLMSLVALYALVSADIRFGLPESLSLLETAWIGL